MKIIYSGYLSSFAISTTQGGIDFVVQVKDLRGNMHHPLTFNMPKEYLPHAQVGERVNLTIETTERA